MGKRSSAEDSDARALTGFEEVLPIEKFEAELDQALSANEKIYALQNTPFSDRPKSLYPFRDSGRSSGDCEIADEEVSG